MGIIDSKTTNLQPVDPMDPKGPEASPDGSTGTTTAPKPSTTIDSTLPGGPLPDPETPPTAPTTPTNPNALTSGTPAKPASNLPGTTAPTTPTTPTTPPPTTPTGARPKRDGSTAQAQTTFNAAIQKGLISQAQVSEWSQLQASGKLPTYDALNNPATRPQAMQQMTMYYLNAYPNREEAFAKLSDFKAWIPNADGDQVPLGLNRNELPGGALYEGSTDGFSPNGPAGSTPPGTTPPPGAPGTPTTGTPTTGGQTVWSPTGGIIDQIVKAPTQDVTASTYTPAQVAPTQQATATGYDAIGYTAEKAPDAVGYDATGYEADKTKENLSQAVARIVGQDSEILQHEQGMADVQSNARGILNSTMGIQAGRAAVLDKATSIGAGDVQAEQFNVAQVNAARAFMADAKNQAAQFLAAEKNNNGRFNAEQANQAAAFTANAQNAAAQFLAASKNAASMFNAGEANKAALFAVEQTNLALRFAAEAQNAAKEFNATAFNQANQRYTDAMNAAIAAQNDAINLSRRDTAQINAQLQTAQLGANTSLQIAQINAATQAKALDQQAQQFGLTLAQRDREFVAGLSTTQFNSFMTGFTAIMLQDMEPEARQNALHNYMAVWSANGTLPFDIDMDAFPPAGGTTTTP